MLKKRIIPILLYANGRLVKSFKFDNFRDVGDPVRSSKVYSDQDADELIVLNVNRGFKDTKEFSEVISEISKVCFVPLTVGGGIKNIEDAKLLFNSGADKIALTTAPLMNISLVEKLSNLYGRQAIVVGVDLGLIAGEYKIHSNNGKVMHNYLIEDYIKRVIFSGAGELLLQVIDCDGAMSGYQLSCLNRVLSSSTVPVICGSGSGNFDHLKQALELGADAVACGSLFNFGDNNPLRAKAYLVNYGIPLKRV